MRRTKIADCGSARVSIAPYSQLKRWRHIRTCAVWLEMGLWRLPPASSRLETQSIEIYGKAANVLCRVVRAPRTAPENSRIKVCLEGNSIRVAHYSDPEGAEGTTERCIYVCLVSSMLEL